VYAIEFILKLLRLFCHNGSTYKYVHITSINRTLLACFVKWSFIFWEWSSLGKLKWNIVWRVKCLDT